MTYRYANGAVIGPRFWSRLTALGLGMLLGLWLTGEPRQVCNPLSVETCEP